ncbi:hypothetical protein MKW94_016121, partial [Papaver nudicaule]|nr:hypothetical protein [Papaver nudicaule]
FFLIIFENADDPAEVVAVEERDPMYNEEKDFSNLQLTSESGLNAELANRLLQMVPGPIDDSQSEHLRLLQRLEKFGLTEIVMKTDGNCQFRSLSDQLYGSPDHHEYVRQKIVSQLKSEEEVYKDFVDMQYEAYLQKISTDGEWGDHVTLKAASDLFGVKIFVITTYRDTCYYEINPKTEKSTQVMCLSFRVGGEHYNSIVVGKNDDEEASALSEVHLPIVPASWKSCCGMLEALFGSDL